MEIEIDDMNNPPDIIIEYTNVGGERVRQIYSAPGLECVWNMQGVKIFDRALTKDQIERLHARAKTHGVYHVKKRSTP